MNPNSYSPGLHKLLTLQVSETNKLTDSNAFARFTDSILEKYQLEKLGSTIYDFENQSFTIAVCLKESHICIHTWPEYKQLTLDVYLCNYLQDNTSKVKAISLDYIQFFNATIIKDIEINR